MPPRRPRRPRKKARSSGSRAQRLPTSHRRCLNCVMQLKPSRAGTSACVCRDIFAIVETKSANSAAISIA
jgi:hypothetical protein